MFRIHPKAVKTNTHTIAHKFFHTTMLARTTFLPGRKNNNNNRNSKVDDRMPLFCGV